MKIGDLVKLNPTSRWLDADQGAMTGIILDILEGPSDHRKNTTYQVMWSSVWGHHNSNIGWHTSLCITYVK